MSVPFSFDAGIALALTAAELTPVNASAERRTSVGSIVSPLIHPAARRIASQLLRGFRTMSWLGAVLGVGPVGAQTAPPPPSAAADGFRLPPVAIRDDRRVEAFAFEGRSALPEFDLQALAADLRGRRVSDDELEELRLRITRLYVDRGFVNSGAVIPANPLRDGIFTFRIVEGHIGEVRVSGQGRLRSGYVAERLVKGQAEVFDVAVLEDRFRLLLTDPLIGKMNARILPRAELGQALLDVQVERAPPYRLTVFTDNHRPPSIGAHAVGLTGTLWNLTGLGDALDATALASSGARRHGLGWTVPVPRLRTRVELRRESGTASVVEEPVRAIDIASQIDSFEFGAQQPLIEALGERLVLGLVRTRRESRSSLLGEPFSFTPGEPNGRSRLRAWRATVDYARRWPAQVLALKITLTQGRSNIDPGLDEALRAPQPGYRVWLAQAQFVQQAAAHGSQLVMKAALQRTRQRLLPMERLAVGGVATVRGYRENQLVRDEGLAGSVEWQVPWPVAPGSAHRVVLGPFIDFGIARDRGEPADRLRSAGAGLNWRGRGFELVLQVAAKLERKSPRGSGDLQDHGVHFQLRQSWP